MARPGGQQPLSVQVPAGQSLQAWQFGAVPSAWQLPWQHRAPKVADREQSSPHLLQFSSVPSGVQVPRPRPNSSPKPGVAPQQALFASTQTSRPPHSPPSWIGMPRFSPPLGLLPRASPGGDDPPPAGPDGPPPGPGDVLAGGAWPAPAVGCPFWQPPPGPADVPQEPQLCGSLSRSVQEPPQAIRPGAHGVPPAARTARGTTAAATAPVRAMPSCLSVSRREREAASARASRSSRSSTACSFRTLRNLRQFRYRRLAGSLRQSGNPRLAVSLRRSPGPRQPQRVATAPAPRRCRRRSARRRRRSPRRSPAAGAGRDR